MKILDFGRQLGKQTEEKKSWSYHGIEGVLTNNHKQQTRDTFAS